MARAARIFVSHAHEDNAWCHRFVLALRAAGADVWYDEQNLEFGVLSEEIERELRARPIFIVILSPTSVGKPWVRREMGAAIQLRDEEPDRIILPVVAKNIAEKSDLPLFWREFKRVSGPGDAGMKPAEAAAEVVRILAIVPPSVPAAPVASAAPKTVTEEAEEAWERGKGLYVQMRYAEALVAYERATTLEPGRAPYWTGMGSVLWNLNRYEEALVAYERALALDPQFAYAWKCKVALLNKLGRTSEAEETERQRKAVLQGGKR